MTAPPVAPTTAVTQQDIAAALRSLGLTTGAAVVVHSSLSSFGRVSGGAPAVIAAIEEVVSDSGTVVMPAMTFGRHHFHPKRTPPLTGRITETFWRMTGTQRSLHPTHSVAARGRLARQLVAGHDQTRPFAPDSPLARLAAVDGWVLLLGVGHTRNSTIHVAEDLVGAPSIQARQRVGVLDDEGRVRYREVTGLPRCSQGFGVVDGELTARGRQRLVRIGAADARLARGADIIAVASEMLRRDFTSLLCRAAGCAPCHAVRRGVASGQARPRRG